MLKVLLFLLFTFLEKGQCGSAPDSFPHFLNQMARGVDLASLDLFPLDLGDDNGFRSQILTFSFTDNSSTFLYIGAEKQSRLTSNRPNLIPDQVSRVDHFPSAWVSPTPNPSLTTEAEVLKMMSENVGVDESIGVFSKSKSFQSLNKQIIENGTCVDSKSLVPIIKTQMKPSVTLRKSLTSEFSDEVDALPETYDDGKYQKFLDYFGTHYFSDGTFGYGVGPRTDRLDELSSWFRNSIDKNMSVVYGGSVEAFASKDLTAFVASGWKHPWLLSGKLEPISELVGVEAKKESLEKATEIRLLRSYLSYLNWQLEIGKTRYTGNKSETLFSELAQKIEKQMGKPFPAKEEIQSIADQIQFNLRIPEWWRSEELKLCYQHKTMPSSSSSSNYRYNNYDFCGARSPSCAQINNFTGSYIINKQRDTKTCYVSWKISSSSRNSHDLQEKLRLCFKYNTDFNGSACSSDSAHEQCVGINEYTGNYYDTALKRRGNCTMNWKLSVEPDTIVPFWLKNTRLCLKYGPSQRYLASSCAWFGHWTENFVTGKESEFEMQWGIFDSQ